MKCIHCKNTTSKVIDSRFNPATNSIRRRRECLKCGKRFTTYETVELVPLFVVKSDGRREPYDINKIRTGVVKSFVKRPISMSQIDELVARIDNDITKSVISEIRSSDIGEKVMDELKKLDEIAYIRYACVYRNFKDVTNLLRYLKDDLDTTIDDDSQSKSTAIVAKKSTPTKKESAKKPTKTTTKAVKKSSKSTNNKRKK